MQSSLWLSLVAVGFLSANACANNDEGKKAFETGGTGNATGGVSFGGTSNVFSIGGSTASTGGSTASTGGKSSAGGSTASTGGKSAAGGSTASTGGKSAAGGSTASTGGKSSAGGSTANTGGKSSAGGSTASTGGTSGGSVFPAGVTKPRIMIVGDSISASPGCYKKSLLKNLQDNGYSRFEFVGAYEDSCAGGNVRHSAVGCTTTDDFTQATFTVPNCFSGESFSGMSKLVTTYDPDMIMIQLGVNDVWGGSAAIAPILNNYSTLVQQARAQNPNVVIVVAQIHKIVTEVNCTNSATTPDANAEELVNAVPGWAQGVTTAASPVFVADLWTNSIAGKEETDDCVHPNDAGALRMGLNWYNAIKDILPKD